jgi:hypothetical protein
MEMTQQPATKNQKGFFQNDRKLVGSMLVVYGLCILGVIALTFWGLNGRRLILSANATSTAYAIATQQANTTATAAAFLLEQDQYEYVERFEQSSTDWFVGVNNVGKPNVETLGLKDGVYFWNILDSDGFTRYMDFKDGTSFTDFDAYMDWKVADSSPAEAICSGFVFRKSSLGWEGGAYVFRLCNDSHYAIHYYENEKWEAIQASTYHDAIRSKDWNRIGIGARNDHFTFTINNVMVFEVSDGRRKSGSLGIYVQIPDNEPTILWFDNFGFQSR